METSQTSAMRSRFWSRHQLHADWSDATATDLRHREIIRIVDDLDGILYVGRAILAGTPLLVDPQDGRIGLDRLQVSLRLWLL